MNALQDLQAHVVAAIERQRARLDWRKQFHAMSADAQAEVLRTLNGPFTWKGARPFDPSNAAMREAVDRGCLIESDGCVWVRQEVEAARIRERLPARPAVRPASARVHVIVEVDPALAVGMTARGVARLERGVTLERDSSGDVLISGLPGLRAEPLRAASMAGAVMHLHALADGLAEMATAAGGLSTATGRYALDRAALLREAARVCVVYRCGLWPDEPWSAS